MQTFLINIKPMPEIAGARTQLSERIIETILGLAHLKTFDADEVDFRDEFETGLAATTMTDEMADLMGDWTSRDIPIIPHDLADILEAQLTEEGIWCAWFVSPSLIAVQGKLTPFS